MEDLFGILIFIFVAAVSILGKLAERKKREQSNPPPLGPIDLGEEIKRLFGETPQVRKARPAQHPAAEQDEEGWTRVPSQVARPAQHPITPQPQSREYRPRVATPSGPRPQTAPGPVVRPPAAQPPSQPRVTVGEDTGPRIRRPEQVRVPRSPQRPSEEGPRIRPEQVRAHRPAPVQPEGEGPTVRPRDVRVPRASEPQPAAAAQAMAASVQRAGRQAAREALEAQAKVGASEAQATRMRAKRQAAVPQMGLLSNLRDVRKGIILMEVLGPPVALREPGAILP